MRTPVKVKICGLTRREDVELAAGLGADFLGFVLAPASKRYVPPERWRSLTENLPGHIRRVAVVVDPAPETLAEIRKVFDVIQFHGSEPPELARGAGSWKALHLEREFGKLKEYDVEHFIIDSATGGSGVRCDWRTAAEAAKEYEILLAGGLTPDNVAEAIRQVKPWGVDVSGGVEAAPGIKSKEKLIRFMKEAGK
ncbi:N-(5'-phosphoribosyl)anthranilate isomerase [bioreactor metagenome]|uniref:phosphoribosylanthranilate isomerase n=1 Tax=bioreactor metagenome TaxID=1076179 RepID=A0A645C4F8_9ZZZZ